MITANIYTPLDGRIVLLQLCCWKFIQKETSYQSLFDLIWFLFTKMTHLLFEPPFGWLMGNICTSSIAHWKASGRLPIRDNWTFFASSYCWDVRSRYWSKSALFGGWLVTLSATFRWKGTSSPAVVRRVFLLPHSEDGMILSAFVWIQYQHVTDGQTDGQNCCG